jgi:ABC-type uncharacterized transport system substrate-binding protein
MDIIFSRHAKRQMKWRKITEIEVKSVIDAPDSLMDSVKDRKNAFKMIGDRNLKITYQPENGSLTIITAMVKGK